MRNNTKGFTVIELVLSFSLVMFLAVSMFAVVNNYRNRQQKEAVNRDLTKFTTGLTQDIYEDIYKKKVKEIKPHICEQVDVDTCKYKDKRPELCNCQQKDVGDRANQWIVISFQDKTTKQLKIEMEEVEDDDIVGTTFKYEDFSIVYGTVKYKNPVPKFTKIVSDYMLTYSTEEDNLEEGTGTIYKIEIRLAHQDIDEEFKIEVITTGTE